MKKSKLKQLIKEEFTNSKFGVPVTSYDELSGSLNIYIPENKKWYWDYRYTGTHRDGRGGEIKTFHPNDQYSNLPHIEYYLDEFIEALNSGHIFKA